MLVECFVIISQCVFLSGAMTNSTVIYQKRWLVSTWYNSLCWWWHYLWWGYCQHIFNFTSWCLQRCNLVLHKVVNHCLL